MTDDSVRQFLKDKLAASATSLEAQEWSKALRNFEIALAVRANRANG